MVIYAEAREQFLNDNPICQMLACHRASIDVHHTCGRLDGNYLNRETWRALCRKHHDFVHEHPKWSRKNGWLK